MNNMEKEYKPRDIRYGLIAIDPAEEGEMKTVQHFCGYWNEPNEIEAQSLLEELMLDEEFGLTEIADRLVIMRASDDLVQEYVTKIIEHEKNNNN
jgi:hypothetical protein